MSDISTPPESRVPPVQQVMLAHAPPLPPVAELTPEQMAAASRRSVRVWCAFVFVMCVLMLGVALWLSPDKRGMETHRQLGLLPCGFMKVTGYPCPTCGCTTAVSHFAHGNFAQSLFTQPFGFAVALAATVLVPLTGVGMVTGRWKGPSGFWMGWYWRMWVYGGILLLVASWLYKMWLVKVGLSG